MVVVKRRLGAAIAVSVALLAAALAAVHPGVRQVRMYVDFYRYLYNVAFVELSNDRGGIAGARGIIDGVLTPSECEAMVGAIDGADAEHGHFAGRDFFGTTRIKHMDLQCPDEYVEDITVHHRAMQRSHDGMQSLDAHCLLHVALRSPI